MKRTEIEAAVAANPDAVFALRDGYAAVFQRWDTQGLRPVRPVAVMRRLVLGDDGQFQYGSAQHRELSAVTGITHASPADWAAAERAGRIRRSVAFAAQVARRKFFDEHHAELETRLSSFFDGARVRISASRVTVELPFADAVAAVWSEGAARLAVTVAEAEAEARADATEGWVNFSWSDADLTHVEAVSAPYVDSHTVT